MSFGKALSPPYLASHNILKPSSGSMHNDTPNLFSPFCTQALLHALPPSQNAGHPIFGWHKQYLWHHCQEQRGGFLGQSNTLGAYPWSMAYWSNNKVGDTMWSCGVPTLFKLEPASSIEVAPSVRNLRKGATFRNFL